MRLKDKAAFVTGGARGIGRAIAVALAEEGADVAICSRTQSELDATASAISALGRKAVPLILDVTKADDIQSAFDHVVGELGCLDILVNNAGGLPSDLYAVQPADAEGIVPTWQISEDMWDVFLNANLKSVFLCTQAAFRYMADNGGGEIINIASQMGHGRATTGGPYAVAKRGVIALTEVFAHEGREFRIRVNAVSPGLVTTPGQTRFMKEILGIDEDKQPPGQPPENVAKAVLYLLCDAPAEMRGQSILQF